MRPTEYLALPQSQRTPEATREARLALLEEWRETADLRPVRRRRRPYFPRSQRRRSRLALRLRYQLLKVLSGGQTPQCRACGCLEYKLLQVHHVAGRTWRVHSTDSYGRYCRYWAEWRRDVPLEVRCLLCNSMEGRPAFAPPLPGDP